MALSGHTALVTGGAVRIGAATCRALAAGGCNVVIHCNRSTDAAAALAEELMQQGVRACVVSGELTADAAGVVDQAWDAAGPVDILVNNASVFHKHVLTDVSEADLRADFEVNLVAPLLVSRRFVTRLRDEDRRERMLLGRIVNLLDRRVSGVEAGCIPYLLSKKALADLTRSAALEWAPEFTVNGVAPGAILPPPGESDDYLADAAGTIPLQGRIQPDEVARAVVFVLSGSSMTGQVLYVDGGQHLLGGQV